MIYMSEKKDYCQYYLDKCTEGTIPSFIQRIYKTTDTIRDDYEGSTCFLRSPDDRNKYLVDTLSSFIQRDCERFDSLDVGASSVLQRTIKRISNAVIYDDVFGALSDYLWVEASAKVYEDRKISSNISLIANEMLENRKSMEWIEGVKEKIDNAKYDLSCMQEADNLMLGKRILLGLVENPDVAWYADARNISYSERRQRISDCKGFIKEHEMIYFAFLVTNLYHEKLRRRYR